MYNGSLLLVNRIARGDDLYFVGQPILAVAGFFHMCAGRFLPAGDVPEGIVKRASKLSQGRLSLRLSSYPARLEGIK